MKVLFDTNIILDVLAKRAEFFEKSNKVLSLAAGDTIIGAITANTVTDIVYLLQKYKFNRQEIRKSVKNISQILQIPDLTKEQCIDSFDLPFSDYEDALVSLCASHWGADYIITRNTKDFKNSVIEAVTPAVFLEHRAQ